MIGQQYYWHASAEMYTSSSLIKDFCIASQDLKEFKLLAADTHHKGWLTTKCFAYFQEICWYKNFL